MDQNGTWFTKKRLPIYRYETRKRKKSSDQTADFSWDDLNQDLLERVLSWLPTSSFFRLRSVCKRWSSVSLSKTFMLACSQVPKREPWFYMVDPNCSKPIIYDTAQSKWCNINHPELLETNNGLLPVASSGGLLCFRSFSGEFFISNPVSGSHRKLPHVDIEDTVHAIAMSSSSLSSYKLILVHGDPSSLTVKTFDSTLDHWTVSMLHRKTKFQQLALPESGDEYGDETLYYLSKAGDVVATDMQRSPSKQFSSVVITEKNGNEVLYFLSQSGRVVGCNLSEGFWYEYPKILPPFFEHSLDLVECRGEMLVVVMSELLESASLRVWRFSEEKGLWVQVGAIPPSMSHEFYGKKADINCVGHGNLIMVCVSSVSCGFNCEVLCNLEENSWVELPECFISGKPKEFVSAFSFEPRLEACV